MIVSDAIIQECRNIRKMLIKKNKAYGNSVFEPINIFSKTDWENQIRVRIDDKLNRLAKGNEYLGDDTILDLIGYLILLRVGKQLYIDHREH
jgi:hypothetical protein